MLPRSLYEFAASHDGAFRTADAAERGCSAQRLWRALERGEIIAAFEGIYRLAGAPKTWRTEARCAGWAANAPSGLSHRSAAYLLGLPGGSSSVLELLCVRWQRARAAGLVVHEFSGLQPADVTTIDGLPCVVPELALLQIAGRRWATVEHVERAIYAARRRRLLSDTSLQEYLYRRARRGRPGVRKLRAALAITQLHQRPTESEMETLLLQTLRCHGLPEPVLQFEVRDAAGRFVARVDAALTDWDILLEYDSDQEHLDGSDLARDSQRRLWAARYGYWMIPVRAADLRNGGRALAAAIHGAIRRLEHAPERAYRRHVISSLEIQRRRLGSANSGGGGYDPPWACERAHAMLPWR